MSRPPGAGAMSRVFGMLLAPGRTWESIDGEVVAARSLLLRYVAPLAAIPAVCAVAGPLIFDFNIANIGVHMSLLGRVLAAVAGWGLTLAAVYALAVFVGVTAPAFGGVRNRDRALKLIAYAGTASWVGGLAELYPNLGIPVGLLAGLYSLYALFVGLPKLMKIPVERRLVAFGAVLVAVLLLVALRGFLTARAAELGGPLSASYAAPR